MEQRTDPVDVVVGCVGYQSSDHVRVVRPRGITHPHQHAPGPLEPQRVGQFLPQGTHRVGVQQDHPLVDQQDLAIGDLQLQIASEAVQLIEMDPMTHRFLQIVNSCRADAPLAMDYT